MRDIFWENFDFSDSALPDFFDSVRLWLQDFEYNIFLLENLQISHIPIVLDDYSLITKRHGIELAANSILNSYIKHILLLVVILVFVGLLFGRG